MEGQPKALDFFTNTELIECLRDRLESREMAYLFVWAYDDGENWMIADNLEYDHLQDVYEIKSEDFEQEILNTDTWQENPEDLEAFEEDFSEDDED